LKIAGNNHPFKFLAAGFPDNILNMCLPVNPNADPVYLELKQSGFSLIVNFANRAIDSTFGWN